MAVSSDAEEASVRASCYQENNMECSLCYMVIPILDRDNFSQLSVYIMLEFRVSLYSFMPTEFSVKIKYDLELWYFKE